MASARVEVLLTANKLVLIVLLVLVVGRTEVACRPNILSQHYLLNLGLRGTEVARGTRGYPFGSLLMRLLTRNLNYLWIELVEINLSSFVQSSLLSFLGFKETRRKHFLMNALLTWHLNPISPAGARTNVLSSGLV